MAFLLIWTNNKVKQAYNDFITVMDCVITVLNEFITGMDCVITDSNRLITDTTIFAKKQPGLLK